MNQNRKIVIALGFFDGVHLGHGALLRRVVERAAELGAVPAAVTFDNHPENVISGQARVPLINAPVDRSALMDRLYGIRQVLFIHFGQTMMHMDWRDFVTEFLVKKHGAVHLVAGHDFRFGYRGLGNPQRLLELCGELGIGCDIIPKVELDGVTVSSTYIRALIAQGDMERAGRFLGHPHVLSGTVVHGAELGRKLGTPTANLTVPAGVLPPAFGVYASRVWVLPEYPDRWHCLPGAGPYLAVTNVGVRPTVSDVHTVSVEPWILDFDGDLYGRTVRIEFYRQLRPERKFASVEDLRAAILENARETRSYFAEKEDAAP